MEAESLEFLGHTISRHGLKPNESKIKAILEFRAPKSIEEIQSFLGLVTYVGSKFILNLSTLTDPLRALIRKDADFKWNLEHHLAFETIKKAMSNEMILGFYSPADKTQLYTDASLGALLVQYDNNNKSRVVGIASKSLTSVEQRYCQGEKESLAIVWALERFKYYLLGIEFDLLTDNRATKILFGANSRPCARTERWVLRVQGFKMNLIHIPGKVNLADALSRLCQSSESKVSVNDEVKDIVLQIAMAA